MLNTERRPTYAELLSKWVEESGLTLREIAARCGDAGQPVTHSYISKLRLANASPPSWEISEALAKALGKDHAPLGVLFMIERVPDQAWRDFLWTTLSLAAIPTNLSPLEQVEQLHQFHLEEIPQLLTALIQELRVRAGDKPPFVYVTDDGTTAGPGNHQHVVDPDRPARLLIFDRVPDRPIDGTAWQDEAAGGTVAIDFQIAMDATYALSAPGSIAEIGAREGDLLLIRPGGEDIESGDTVLVRMGDVIAARRYYQVRGGYRLEPELPGDAPARDVELLGIVRGLVRSL